MTVQYTPDWTLPTKKGWVVDPGGAYGPGISAKDLLTFEGTGSTVDTKLTNETTKTLWSSGFSYDGTNKKVGSAGHGLTTYDIFYHDATATETAWLKFKQNSGGAVWTAHEGG